MRNGKHDNVEQYDEMHLIEELITRNKNDQYLWVLHTMHCIKWNEMVSIRNTLIHVLINILPNFYDLIRKKKTNS